MFWTIVFAIIAAFFGILLIGFTAGFLARLWDEHREQFIGWVIVFPALGAGILLFNIWAWS